MTRPDLDVAWQAWYAAQLIKPFPYHTAYKCFAAGYLAASPSGERTSAPAPEGEKQP